MKKMLLLLLIAALLATGCSREKKPSDEGEGYYSIYFTNGEETMLIETKYHAEATEAHSLVAELAEAMSIVPESGAYKKVRPEDMNIFYRYALTSNGALLLYYDETYHNLKGTSEVLYRAAVVKTLGQIKGVNAIEFYVNDEPLTDSDGNTIGVMYAENFLDNTMGELNITQTMVLEVYYATSDGEHLRPVNINTTYDGTHSLEYMVVAQLIDGPENVFGISEDLQATLPKCKINKISVREGVCYVDLSQEFMTKRAQISDEVTLYAVVNSLTTLDDVAGVQFLIDGQTRENYFGIQGFDRVFERNESMVIK